MFYWFSVLIEPFNASNGCTTPFTALKMKRECSSSHVCAVGGKIILFSFFLFQVWKVQFNSICLYLSNRFGYGWILPLTIALCCICCCCAVVHGRRKREELNASKVKFDGKEWWWAFFRIFSKRKDKHKTHLYTMHEQKKEESRTRPWCSWWFFFMNEEDEKQHFISMIPCTSTRWWSICTCMRRSEWIELKLSSCVCRGK